MAEPGCGAQFRAAVRVIQGLPRSGSYRPSYEEMLRFYSYYKQATAGRCQGPRPGFWDPIGRYKWDAWHSLGRMSKEEAMAAYVAEMKKVAQKVAGSGGAGPVPPAGPRRSCGRPQVIDTVPMDEATREMFKYFEPLYEVIRDMPRPPEDFFKGEGDGQEQAADPSQDERASSPAQERREEQDGQRAPGGGLAPAADTREGSQVASDSEGEVFCDTLEQMEPEQAGQPLAKQGLSPSSAQAGPEPRAPRAAGRGERSEGRRRAGRSGTGLAAPGSDRDPQLAGAAQDAEGTPELAHGSQGLLVEVDAHVAGTVRALQDDMQRVLQRLSELETLASAQGDASGTERGRLLAPQAASPWPLAVSPRTLLFLLAWPFVTQWLLRRWQGTKR
ncbi:LOW QUALITY PROTEIN: acyl-CoA-binding domain-containing protein 4 [Cygnus olor]|uniref:LOW QUALITY PROTEIN: acyl-CoA-binding domain-containing protein 4 n=1 Tax=Cygnus olor TaxID=8869 RepID=UPI001ADE6EA5|nr:LOW QUALITY PROTEIN: acyl-CoA-binding domain-containing protein 4 [Cygnus olor]